MANVNIALIQLANTFNDWRIMTNNLANSVNELRNGFPYYKDNGGFTLANGGMQILLPTGTQLTVVGNALFQNTATINTGAITNLIATTTTTATINVTNSGVYQNGVLVLANVAANINYINTATVNATVSSNGTVQSNVGFSVNLTAVQSSAYGQANAAYAQANAAYAQANLAYTAGNSGITIAEAAYAEANGAYGQANLAYTAANNAGKLSVVGAFRNLKANASGSNAVVQISADEVILENNSNQYITLRNLTLSANILVGGVNGLDTGSPASSTWYSLWIIYNGSTASALLSASTGTAPTSLPGGYSYYARFGYIRTDSTVNKFPLAFIQRGRVTHYVIGAGNLTSPLAVCSGIAGSGSYTAATPAAFSVSNYVPPSASFIKVYGSMQDLGTNSTIYGVAPNGNLTNIFLYPCNRVGNQYNQNHSTFAELMLESTNLYYWSNDSLQYIYVLGWEDNL